MSNRNSELPQRPDLVRLSACLAWLVNLVSRQSASHRFLSGRTSSGEDSAIRSRIALALTGVDVTLERRRAEAAVAHRHRLEAERGEAAVVMLRKSQELVREAMGAGWTEPLPPDVLASVSVLADKSQTGRAPEDLQADGAALVAAVRSWADRASGSRAAAAAAQEAVGRVRWETDESRRNATDRGEFGERDSRRAALFLLGVPGTGRLAAFASPVASSSGNAVTEERERRVARQGADQFLRVIGKRGASEHSGIEPLDWLSNPEASVPVAASRQIAKSMMWKDEDAGQGIPLVEHDGRFQISHRHLARFGDVLARRLPLCATQPGRLALANLSFVPVPKSVEGKNIRNLFKPAYWTGLSKNLVTLRGGLCCVCGSPVGAMSIGGWPKPNRGAIEVHEAWTWSIADAERRIGIQRLVSLLPVCSDCHKMFHVDQLIGNARTHAQMFGGDPNHLWQLAVNFMVSRRAEMLSGLTGFPHQIAAARMAEEGDASRGLSDAADRWIVDLSSLRLLDLAGAPPVFGYAQGFRCEPYDISGIEFHREDGQVYPAISVQESLQMIADEIDHRAAASPTKRQDSSTDPSPAM